MLGGKPEIKPQIRGSTMWAKLNTCSNSFRVQYLLWDDRDQD